MIEVDFDYYSNKYCGEIIPYGAFVRNIRKAEAYINNLTMGKAENAELESVKLAICNVAELFYLDETRQGISAENSDGYSVTYTEGNIEHALSKVATIYLADSGLLYAGDERVW